MAENDDAPPEPTGSDATSTDDATDTRDVALAPDHPRAASSATESAAAVPSRYRRLHTLSGAVALGAFLVEHLLTNASALGGAARFDAVVGALARSGVAPVFEVVFVLLPLGFHAFYGIHLLRRGRVAEVEIERFGSKRHWKLQRISAVVLFAFVLVHLWDLRFQRLFFGLAADALYTSLSGRLSSTWGGVPWIALLYLTGVLAAAAHVSNGLFAATSGWKSTADEGARARRRALATAMGLILFLVGATTVIGIATGTRLLPGADDDSAAPAGPCGSAAPAPSPPFVLPTPSR